MSSSPDKPEIATAYDRWAATYDDDVNRTRELAAEVLRQRGLALAGRDVLEIGCGTGRNTQWLDEHATSVLALDFSEGMLRRARARVSSPRVQFVQHDIRVSWPLAAGSSDVVIAMLVLEHIEHIDAVFAEAARVLRGGGELFLCELHPVRQMRGGQANFVNPETGQPERVTAFLHDVSQYVNGGLGAGFELVHLGEWRDAEAVRSDPPRLLSVQLRRTARHPPGA